MKTFIERLVASLVSLTVSVAFSVLTIMNLGKFFDGKSVLFILYFSLAYAALLFSYHMATVAVAGRLLEKGRKAQYKKIKKFMLAK